MSNYDIFISYSHSGRDVAWVREFARALKNQGVSIWLDVDRLRVGESLPKGLENGLRNSESVVALITPDNVQRANLLFEIGAAIGMGKRIIPIIARDLDASQVPYALRDRMFISQKSPKETAGIVASELSRTDARTTSAHPQKDKSAKARKRASPRCSRSGGSGKKTTAKPR